VARWTEALPPSTNDANLSDADMGLTPGRLMLSALAAGTLVMASGAWLGGRCASQPTGDKTYRLTRPDGDLFVEQWAGPFLKVFPWAFATCGLTFIGAVLWLARVETRDDHRSARGPDIRQ
jgi:hypothetical protein